MAEILLRQLDLVHMSVKKLLKNIGNKNLKICKRLFPANLCTHNCFKIEPMSTWADSEMCIEANE